MATRKGINISGKYAAPHILHALFIYYVLCIFLNERSYKIVFYILFKTQRPSDTLFYFRVNGAPRVWAEKNIFWAQNTDETAT